MKINRSFLTVVLIVILLLSAQPGNCLSGISGVSVQNLNVEYTKTPLGIDVKVPRFGWQMQGPDNLKGLYQTAYRLVVKNSDGDLFWDSGKIKGEAALAIEYAGKSLVPKTRYDWTIHVWDQNNKEHHASSWFETGLMNPNIEAWDGAQWIGGSDDDLVFFSDYQLIFKMKYSLAIAVGSTKAGFIYGANDMRLMDRYKNIFQIENGLNESYIKLELDISGVDKSPDGLASLNIYRVGYAQSDASETAFKSYDIKPSIINANNKHKKHTIEISSAYGQIEILVDGEKSFFIAADSGESIQSISASKVEPEGATVILNPLGKGHDFIPFGMVCDIGFAMDAGQKATFSNLEIFNDRKPNNTLFKEELSVNYHGIFAGQVSVDNNGYVVEGGSDGIFVVANPSRNSTPMLRTEFSVAKSIASARLYVTSRGIYEIQINGEKVGVDYYNPGQTQYNKTHFYQTYDVTDMLDEGPNAIGAFMAEGWWSGLLSIGAVWNHFGDRQSLLAKLEITYDDGSTGVIATNDKDWKFYNNGPVLYSSLNLGEIYDATKDENILGWSESGFEDSAWKAASIVPLDGTSFSGEMREFFSGEVTEYNFDEMKLIGQIGNNARQFTTLVAKSMEEVRPGVYVYDMGQNFVGTPKITIANGTAGDTMILRVAEMLYPDLEESKDNVGMIMTENYRAAISQDIYIMKVGEQIFQPKFTSHGYQYLEITGIDGPLPLESVQGVSISSIVELTADYETSNLKVNQLWSNLVWSNVDNFLTIPTDCPQRNERMGWSGDISVFSRSATYISNSDQFLRRHMIAMRDVQRESGKFTDIAPIGGGFGGILWGSAGVTVPWEVYQQYNDKALLAEHYDAMVSYIDYLDESIDSQTGLCRDVRLGDWLGPQNRQLGPQFLATAYHVYDLWIIQSVAELLGKEKDALRFAQMYRDRKDFFNKTFVNDEGKTVGLINEGMNVGSSPVPKPEFKVVDTQTSYAVGLALKVFDEERFDEMAQKLAKTIERKNLDDEGIEHPEYSLMTGFIGTAWVSKALSDYGFNWHAYKLLQNNQYPSWLYSIDQGATTIWERLNSYTVENGFGGNNSMNSFNHYTFGAVGQWMLAYSLGIQRDEPGFQRFILQPTPDPTGEMTWAKGYYDSMYGRIYSNWKITGDQLIYEATVPANTTATLYLPTNDLKKITEGGIRISKAKGVKFMRYQDGKVVFELQSGTYHFIIEQFK